MLNGVELKASECDGKAMSCQFALNVKECCRILNIKMGDLELEAGVQLGYLSRFSRGSGIRPGDMLLSNAYKIARLLKVPIEILAVETDRMTLRKIVLELNPEEEEEEDGIL